MPNYTLYYFNGRGRAEILRMMMAAAGVKYMDKRFEFNEWDKYRNDMPCMRVPVLEMDGGNRMPETMAIARYLAREHNFYPKSSMDMMRCDYIADCFYEIMHDYMRYYHWKNGRFRFGNNGMMSSDMGGNQGMMSPDMGGNRGMMSPDMGGNRGMMSPNMGGNRGMISSNMGGNSSDMMSSNYDNYLQWRYMNTFNRIMPFMERTLGMRDGGNKFFMGDMMMWCDMMCYCCMENPYMENQSMFSSYPKLMALYKRVSSHPKICAYLKSRSKTMW